MVEAKKISDCRFCSVISKANGEDPIGTAGSFDHWLILELKQPWSPTMWIEDPRVKPITDWLKKLMLFYGIKIRPIAIAPDPEYSQKGLARLIYYRRPTKLFSEYEKQVYIVPESELKELASALIKGLMNLPNTLNNFEQYRQKTDQAREILVCTHANVDVACGRFGYPIYKKLRSEYAANSQGNIQVWRCSHFGGHQFAPTLIDLPQGRYWGHLEPDSLNLIIHRTGSVSDLRPFFRGWAGLGKLEQIVEREIWTQQGWEWLNYPKTGGIVELENSGIKNFLYKGSQYIPFNQIQLYFDKWVNQAKSARVFIKYMNLDNKKVKQIEAKVEVKSLVMTAAHSGQNIDLKPTKQYYVSDLKLS